MPFPPGTTQTVQIVQWDGRDLPKPIQRSEQPPLSDEDLIKLTKAGFGSDSIVEMVNERRCACDASAAGLVRLKKAGVAQKVLMAVSLQALRPNRGLDLALTLDFAGDGNRARDGFLYVFVDDGDVTRVFEAPLDELLSHRFTHEEMVDRSDLLIARSIRRVQLDGALPLTAYGKHTLLVAFSANPAVTHPSQLNPADRAAAQSYAFVYPAASLTRQCRLASAFKRDQLLVDRWHFQGSHFDCQWN